MLRRTPHRASRLVAALLAFGSVLVLSQPQPAEAATATAVTWNHAPPVVLKTGVPKMLSLTGLLLTAPKITFTPLRNHPCYVSQLSSRAYTATAKLSTVSYLFEKCTVNASMPAPSTITPRSATYYVLSNGPVKIENGFYCIAKCNYNDGVNESIIRWRTGTCYQVWAAPDFSNDTARGGMTPVTCQHTISIAGPGSRPANTVFDVTARSTLLVFVTLATTTPDICRVTKTWQQRTHQVKGLKKGTCKLKASYPGSAETLPNGTPQIAPASSATLSVRITNSPVAVVDTAQKIAVRAPSSVVETSPFSITASSSSGLPVELILDPSSACQPTGTANEFRADFYSPNAACVVTAVQPGGTMNGVEYEPAEDVNITIPIACSPEISCPPPPTCNPDAQSAAYEANQAFFDNVLDNDSGLGLTAAIASRPSAGALTLEPNGAMTWSAPLFFVGTTSFSYTATDVKGQRCTGTVSFTVQQPEIPPAPPITPTITVSTGAWARLNLSERFYLKAALNCPLSSTPSLVCGNTPEASSAIVGAYSEVVAVSVSNLELTAPPGYPTNRYTFTPPTLTDLTPTSFVSGVSGTMRFQQATSATAKFELKAGYTLTTRTVRWSRFNGVLQRIEGPSNTTVASTSAKFGVVGASN